MGRPVYCAGLTANSPARSGPGTVGLPVILGGLRICSGDILVGDRDGVVVVPLDRAEAVLAALTGVKTAEANMEAAVRGGLEVPAYYRAMLAAGRIEEVP